ncbi:MAG: 50S ribosomal protein L23 [Saprospiraceae bacterium]|nr:50S ribosomal protein L23 [Saprospiraceae bacterium]
MGKQIIIKPIISEKAEKLSEKRGHYTFMVDRGANKVEIRKEVEKIYNVNVDSVNTLVVPGKSKRRNTRGGMVQGRKPAYKKAIITLAAGEEIDFFGDI